MAAKVDDTEAFIAADVQLHTAILVASHNELLIEVVDSTRAALRLSRTVTTSIPGAHEATLAALAGRRGRSGPRRKGGRDRDERSGQQRRA